MLRIFEEKIFTRKTPKPLNQMRVSWIISVWSGDYPYELAGPGFETSLFSYMICILEKNKTFNNLQKAICFKSEVHKISKCNVLQDIKLCVKQKEKCQMSYGNVRH